MRRNVLKVLLLIFLFTIMFPENYIYAGDYSISNIFIDAENFVHSGNDVSSMIDTGALKKTSTFIYEILFSIGLIVAVAVGIVLGIQFMISSAVDKAKIKETLIGYVIGCVVLFGAFGIWKMVINIVQETTSVTIDSSEGSSEKSSSCPHPDITGAGTCESPSKCNACGKIFAQEHHYISHGAGINICEFCGEFED